EEGGHHKGAPQTQLEPDATDHAQVTGLCTVPPPFVGVAPGLRHRDLPLHRRHARPTTLSHGRGHTHQRSTRAGARQSARWTRVCARFWWNTPDTEVSWQRTGTEVP